LAFLFENRTPDSGCAMDPPGIRDALELVSIFILFMTIVLPDIVLTTFGTNHAVEFGLTGVVMS
jgi:hypothetical protein